MTSGRRSAASRHRSTLCALVVVVALSTWVKVDAAPPVRALPFGEQDAHAVTEALIANHPEVGLDIRHVAVLSLEATGTPPGDTGAEEGVDAVPYVFDRPLRITLRIHASADQVGRLVLKDPRGREVACLEAAGVRAAADGESTVDREADRIRSAKRRAARCVQAPSVHVHPGAYLLEVHHARKGQADAPTQRVFVRPRFETTTAGATAPRLEPEARVTLEASGNCENCDFAKAVLDGQDFSGLTLTGSSFASASLVQTKFIRAVLQGCDFRGPSPLRDVNYFTHRNVLETDFTGADLTGARFDGVFGSDSIFAGATLDETTWGPRTTGIPLSGDTEVYGASMIGSDFTGASIKLATFNGAYLDGAVFDAATVEAGFQTSGIARSLPGFGFTVGTNGLLYTSCVGCSFKGATIPGSTFDGADLTQAVFSNAVITTTTFNGAKLTNATLTQAQLNDVSLFGTTLTGVDLTAIAAGSTIRSDFSGDLTGANLSDVNFTGFDLSAADLSHAILSSQALASLGGAVLSDGLSRGVTLAGMTFPANFAGFQGKDLRFADLAGITLTGAVLTNAKLAHANLTGAIMTGANLGGADLTNATLSDASLGSAQLQHATLAGGVLQGTILDFANLDGANLLGAHLNKSPSSGVGASLGGAFLRNANLASANLSAANFSSANFYSSICAGTTGCECSAESWDPTSPTCATAVGATMTGTVFTGAYLAGVDMSGATPQAAHFDGAVLVGVSFAGAVLTEDLNGDQTLFTGAFLQGVDFTNALVTGAEFTSAYVDLNSAQGATMAFLLDGTHTSFTGYWGTAQAPACVQVLYNSPTALPPVTDGSNLCPDGVTRGPCSSSDWQSPHTPISNAVPPSSVCEPGTCHCTLPPSNTPVEPDLKWILG